MEVAAEAEVAQQSAPACRVVVIAKVPAAEVPGWAALVAEATARESIR